MNRADRTTRIIPILGPKPVAIYAIDAIDGTDKTNKKNCDMTKVDSAVCPDCGVELRRYGACFSCPVCGLGSCG